MVRPFPLPSPQTLASTRSSTLLLPIILLSIGLEEVIILPNMLLQEVVTMPAMEHLGTMLPMEVQRGTTPHMEVVLKPTTHHMVVVAPKLTMLTMGEARTQLPLLRHTEHQLQHQAIIKRGSVLMSGGLKSIWSLLLHFFQQLCKACRFRPWRCLL